FVRVGEGPPEPELGGERPAPEVEPREPLDPRVSHPLADVQGPDHPESPDLGPAVAGEREAVVEELLGAVQVEPLLQGFGAAALGGDGLDGVDRLTDLDLA